MKREGGRDGKGGWTIFSITEATRNAALEISKIVSNSNQTVIKTVIQTVSKQESKQESRLSSSSSIKVLENLKTTTTNKREEENKRQNLSEEWGVIDFSSLVEIGFSRNHLIQISQQGKLSVEQVQDSINAFAFDLKKNQKTKAIHGSPLGFFMGILRKGCPYTPPENYESPEDEALRKYLEAKRTQSVRRKAMEQELLELEFSEWSDSLSDVERKQYAPHSKIDRSDMQVAELKDYFSKHRYTRREKAGSSEDMRASIRKQIEQSLGPISPG